MITTSLYKKILLHPFITLIYNSVGFIRLLYYIDQPLDVFTVDLCVML